VDATGTNRTVTITPAAGADGVGVVNLSIDDTNGNATKVSFAVMVRPATDVVFVDRFDYPDGVKIFDYSGGLWTRRSQTAGSVNLLTGVGGVIHIRPKASADDGAARLVGAPFNPGSGAVLYSFADAQWTETTATDGVVTNSSGGFLQILNTFTATSAAVAELATSTNGVAEGFFAPALFDGTGSAQLHPARIGQPLTAGASSHTLVTRYDVDTARSTLWVNQTSEAGPSVSAVDADQPLALNYAGLRQDPGMGYIYLDNLRIKVVYKPVVLSTSLAGGDLEVVFQGSSTDTVGSFRVERAEALAGAYQEIPASIENLGNGRFRFREPNVGTSGFFKVKRAPMAF
jgi:hypothetical protein